MCENELKVPQIPENSTDYWNNINQLFKYYFIEPNSIEFPPIRYDLGDFRLDEGDIKEYDKAREHFINDFIYRAVNDEMTDRAMSIYFKSIYNCMPFISQCPILENISPLLEKVAENSPGGKISLQRILKYAKHNPISIVYSVVKYKHFDMDSDTSDCCAICIADYSHGDYLKILPCKHIFHVECIDEWFKRKLNCQMSWKSIVTKFNIQEWAKYNKKLYDLMEVIYDIYDEDIFIDDTTGDYVQMAQALINYQN